MKARKERGVQQVMRLRDHTPTLVQHGRATYRDLPPGMKAFVNKIDDEFKGHWETMDSASKEKANQVYPEIWVGNIEAVHDEELLRKLGIASILNMAIEIDYEPPNDIFVAKVGIDDGVITPVGAFEKAATEIHLARKQDRKILVHCAAGISRSGSAVLSYLMLHKDIGFEKGLRILRAGRHQINPHPRLVRSMMRDFGSRFKK